MDVLVINYTDWVGYHMVNTLLDEGYQVFGKEEHSGNPMLKDYFIRNSNFHPIEKTDSKKYYRTIGIRGAVDQFEQVDTAHKLLINPDQPLKDEDISLIHVPFLFGDFMPMDSSGFHERGKNILFSDEKFKKEGIFIDDFMKIFLKWFKNPTEYKEIFIKRGFPTESEAVILEKTFFIRENMPIDKKLEHLLEHYEQHEAFYPKLKKD